MKLRNVLRLLCTLLALSGLSTAIDRPMASYPINSTGNMMPKWDENNSRVLSYQRQKAGDPVAVQITSIDPAEQTVKINVLKDFPGAVEAIPVDVAPGSDRSVVVACRLYYGKPGSLKIVILTYDPTGKLVKIWDVAPYDVGKIATDLDGNVYAFAVRYDLFNKGSADFSTLVEYDPDGKVEREMLPASLFPVGIDPAEYSGRTGPAFLRVATDRIYVYAAIVGEVFVLDRSGNVLRRHTTNGAIGDLVAGNHYASREMIAGAFDAGGNLYLEIGMGEPVSKGLPNAMRIGTRLDAESLRASHWPSPREVVGREVVFDRRMIGVISDGSVVSLVRANGNFSVEITNH
jgi:hypothetical protein